MKKFRQLKITTTTEFRQARHKSIIENLAENRTERFAHSTIQREWPCLDKIITSPCISRRSPGLSAWPTKSARVHRTPNSRQWMLPRSTSDRTAEKSFSYDADGVLIKISPIDRMSRQCVPLALRSSILRLCHYSLTAELPSELLKYD